MNQSDNMTMYVTNLRSMESAPPPQIWRDACPSSLRWSRSTRSLSSWNPRWRVRTPASHPWSGVFFWKGWAAMSGFHRFSRKQQYHISRKLAVASWSLSCFSKEGGSPGPECCYLICQDYTPRPPPYDRKTGTMCRGPFLKQKRKYSSAYTAVYISQIANIN